MFESHTVARVGRKIQTYMKNIKLVVLVFFFSTVAVNAQRYAVFSLGLKTSIGASHLSGLDDSRDLNYLPGTNLALNGFSSHPDLSGSIGISAQKTYSSQLFIQGDAEFALLRTRIKYQHSDDSFKLVTDCGRLSVYGGRKFLLGQKKREGYAKPGDFRWLIVGVGMYCSQTTDILNGNSFSYTIPEKNTKSGGEDEMKLKKSIYADNVKNMNSTDYGLAFMAGVAMNDWQFALDLHWGMRNMVGNIGRTVNNRMLALSLTRYWTL